MEYNHLELLFIDFLIQRDAYYADQYDLISLGRHVKEQADVAEASGVPFEQFKLELELNEKQKEGLKNLIEQAEGVTLYKKLQ